MMHELGRRNVMLMWRMLELRQWEVAMKAYNQNNKALINSLLLVATADSEIDVYMERFLAEGGRAVLFGESREEYVARRMSAARVSRESVASMASACEAARKIAGPVLVAVDQEIGGIQRLSHLLPAQPALADLKVMSDDALFVLFSDAAEQAKAMGVNVFLAPIVDTLTGHNPWLAGRTISDDVYEVARLSRCFIRAAESCGVMAVVKHFPGHAELSLDPAVEAAAVVELNADALARGFPAFEEGICAGAGGMMLGPAPVRAIDASCAATCSAPVVNLLRQRFNFPGLVVSDGLMAAATAAGRPLVDVAVQAINAGVELLLVASDEQLPRLSQQLTERLESGLLSEEAVLRASLRVKQTINTYDKVREKAYG